jgi:hypothetical protein
MIKIIKWLSHKMGYKIAMIKIGGEVSSVTIEGDKELLRYVDVSGYFFKKEPISRIQSSKAPTSAKEMFLAEPKPDISGIVPIKPLTLEQLKELGIIIDIDVTDCKNFKEASKVQDQIINGDVKISIIKNKS